MVLLTECTTYDIYHHSSLPNFCSLLDNISNLNGIEKTIKIRAHKIPYCNCKYILSQLHSDQ